MHYLDRLIEIREFFQEKVDRGEMAYIEKLEWVDEKIELVKNEMMRRMI
jgi:hypothetical protein